MLWKTKYVCCGKYIHPLNQTQMFTPCVALLKEKFSSS